MASPPSCPGRHANQVVGPGTIDVDTCQAQPVCILVQRTRKSPFRVSAARTGCGFGSDSTAQVGGMHFHNRAPI
ncbi:hypothetical protein AC630_18990 [Bradyrhizobium sp. AS23.2]|nr:hypothetical protein AC630_18990 [Bradyrhizobium sp. AS23.2]